MTSFGGVVLQEAENILSNVSYQFRAELGVVQIGQIFSFDELVFLHNPVQVIAHDHLRYVAHEIVQPIVDASQNVYWLCHVPEFQRDARMSLTTENRHVRANQHLYVLKSPHDVPRVVVIVIWIWQFLLSRGLWQLRLQLGDWQWRWLFARLVGETESKKKKNSLLLFVI